VTTIWITRCFWVWHAANLRFLRAAPTPPAACEDTKGDTSRVHATAVDLHSSSSNSGSASGSSDASDSVPHPHPLAAGKLVDNQAAAASSAASSGSNPAGPGLATGFGKFREAGIAGVAAMLCYASLVLRVLCYCDIFNLSIVTRSFDNLYWGILIGAFHKSLTSNLTQSAALLTAPLLVLDIMVWLLHEFNYSPVMCSIQCVLTLVCMVTLYEVHTRRCTLAVAKYSV
jgi:hypothetical protein